MKALLRFAPILAGLFACAIISVIGVVVGIDDDSGMVVRFASFLALIVGAVVFQLVKNKVNKDGS